MAVVRLVAACTQELLIEPDLSANLALIDFLETHRSQVPEVLRCICNRLRSPDHNVVLLSLSLLDMLVKNCGHDVHFVVQGECMQDVVATSHLSSLVVREKALKLIMDWAQAFENNRRLPGFWETYSNLKMQGVVFLQDDAPNSPIITPKMRGRHVKQNSSAVVLESSSLAAGSAEYISKVKDELRSALEFVRETKHLLQQKILNVRTRALVDVLVEIQRRLMCLLVEVDHEQMVSSSLLLNDCIQSLLVWHGAIRQGTAYKVPEIDVEAALRSVDEIDIEESMFEITPLPPPKASTFEAKESDVDLFASIASRDVKKPVESTLDDDNDLFRSIAYRDSTSNVPPTIQNPAHSTGDIVDLFDFGLLTNNSNDLNTTTQKTTSGSGTAQPDLDPITVEFNDINLNVKGDKSNSKQSQSEFNS